MKDYDPSHNPAHVQRVVALALRILKFEQSRAERSKGVYDELTVHLAALLHDISDRKYLPENSESGSSSFSIPADKLVEHILLTHGADAALAHRVQTIVSHVSYTTERKDPERVRRLIEEEGYPELAVVQDADRLDALGAVGIGRCFTFLGAKGRTMLKEGERWEMDNAIRHFGEKLETLEGMMKTGTGREMARVRTERLGEFRRWWEEEMEEVSSSRT
ncbi:HD domain-containing protein [Aspergillus lucknowensis]|uniref:HD/PDEase domain-containing protein n=1 Tax=Aspergillus lucknowensis TaxID=176173 RepID=A0ABR4LHB2_9EURO